MYVIMHNVLITVKRAVKISVKNLHAEMQITLLTFKTQ